MSERSKVLPWKGSVRQRTGGSNPPFSAKHKGKPDEVGFFYARNEPSLLERNEVHKKTFAKGGWFSFVFEASPPWDHAVIPCSAN